MGVKAYFLSALAVAGLAGGAYYWHKHVGLPDWYWQARLPPTIEQLDVTDTTLLKKVLFSGEPWLIQCYSGLPYAGQHLPAPYRVHETFTQSLQQMRGIVRAGVMDCEKPLPSNKTVVAKFGLVRRTQPLLLFASGGDKPKQVPGNAVGSAYAVTAWVKPKAEPKVRTVSSQKSLQALCGARRSCLLTRLPADSSVLIQLAHNFRTVEVVSLGEEGGKVSVSWGRGQEVGETLEEHEEHHFGARISLMRPDPTAPPARKGAKPAPRILRGFKGDEDYPSVARFITQALEAEADSQDHVFAQLPTVSTEKPKKREKQSSPTQNNNAEVQARRAKKRAEKRAKEEAERAAKAELDAKQSEEMQRRREQRRREQMAAEEEQATKLVDEEEEEEEEAAEEEVEEDSIDLDDDGEGMEALDLDA